MKETFPRLMARGSMLFLEPEGFRVADIQLPHDHPRRREVELALAQAVENLTHNRCPGCNQDMTWRCLGYMHKDEAAPGAGPGWVVCGGNKYVLRTCPTHSVMMRGCPICERLAHIE